LFSPEKHIITDPVRLKEIVSEFSEGPFFCFDVETMGDNRGDPWRNNVTWIAISNGTDSYVIPMGHPHGEFVESLPALKMTADLKARLDRGLKPRKSDYSLDKKKSTTIWTDAPEQMTRTEVFEILRPLFEDPTLPKVGHNLPFDLGSVAKYLGGKIPVGPYADTMVASFIVNPRKWGMGLDDVSSMYTDDPVVKGIGKDITQHAFSEVAEYAWKDAKATADIWQAVSKQIEDDRLEKVFSLEMDVLPILVRMRLKGVPIDTEELSKFKTRLEYDAEAAKAKIFRIAGRTFNLQSNREKQEILFKPVEEGGRGLTPKRLTDGGKEKERKGIPTTFTDYSVGHEALELYQYEDPLIDAILEWTTINKLLTTYVIPYMGGWRDKSTGKGYTKEYKEPLLDDGCLHTDFNQVGAETGRMSSRAPNLQNVPNSRTEYGKLIRKLFVAPPGHKLVVADYSQIEPRIIASFSKDPALVNAYQTGEDVYTTIASALNITRSAAKTLVLAISYGVGYTKVAGQLEIKDYEAKRIMDDFNDKFKNIARLKKLCINTAKSKTPIPYVQTITGRRRYLPDLNSKVKWQVARAERQGFNALIQGTAADVMKIAIVQVEAALPDGAYIVLTVHDELVVVTPEECAEETYRVVKEQMEAIDYFDVPLVVEAHIVDRWGDAK
jgi:DNA polymerase I-like protein with 3'-5' exonuclease and polymerase domains